MSKPQKQSEWMRRRLAQLKERSNRKRWKPPKQIRAIVSTVIFGSIAWIYFYIQFGSYQIQSLEEFERYLQGENLHQKYDVMRITWDCGSLRTQYQRKYLEKVQKNIIQNGHTLVLTRPALSSTEFEQWIEQAQKNLDFSRERRVTSPTNLTTALIVRLFNKFEFKTDKFSRTIINDYYQKCDT